MSRLMKLARIYKAVSYLEKRAFSLAGVQKAVGATAGRATQAEAKAMARAGLSHESRVAQKALEESQGKINELRKSLSSMSKEERLANKARVNAEIAEIRKGMAVNQKQLQEEFKKSYSGARGKGAVSEGQALNRAAINSDEQLLKMRKEQRLLDKKLKDATPEQAKQIKAEIKELQQKQKMRTDEVTKAFNKGDEAVVQRATAKQQAATSQDIHKSAINSDPEMMHLRKSYSDIKRDPSLALEDPTTAMNSIKGRMRERASEVSRDVMNGNQEVINRATSRLQGNQGASYQAQSAKLSPSRVDAPRGGSFVEQQAIGGATPLQKEYNALLKNKDIMAQAEAITGGTADPKMLQAFKSFQRNNPTGTAQEFLAQSKLQSQVRNSMGGGREAGGMFGAEAGNKNVQALTQDLQYGKGQYQFGQEMQNAQNAMNKQYNQYAQTQGALSQPALSQQQFQVQQAQVQQQLAQQQLAQQSQQQIQQNAQQLLQQGKAPNMDAALTQARSNFQAPTQSPLQNIPLTPDQQIALKYTGSAQGAVDTRFVQGAKPIQTTALDTVQQNAISNQANMMKGKDLNQFNQATGTTQMNANQVRQNTIATQNQATAQQRNMSVAGKQPNQSSGDMFGGYGMPLVAGAGLLGAGYLYANSGNSQQPTPYQGGA